MTLRLEGRAGQPASVRQTQGGPLTGNQLPSSCGLEDGGSQAGGQCRQSFVSGKEARDKRSRRALRKTCLDCGGGNTSGEEYRRLDREDRDENDGPHGRSEGTLNYVFSTTTAWTPDGLARETHRAAMICPVARPTKCFGTES